MNQDMVGIHLNLRVVSVRFIAEHPSESKHSGDLVCVNCLNRQFTHTKSPLCIDRDKCSAISNSKIQVYTVLMFLKRVTTILTYASAKKIKQADVKAQILV